MEHLKEKLKDSFDVKYREVATQAGKIDVVFIDTICDASFISEYVITPLVQKDITKASVKYMKEIIVANTVEYIETIDEAIMHVLSGDVVLCFDFADTMLYCESKSFQRRAVSLPETENAIKGSRESFNETLNDNISLLRKRIKNPKLNIETFVLGEQSLTTVALIYLKDTAPNYLVDYIKKSLKSMRKNFIIESNFIEESLKCKRTFFDTVGYSEKPEILASKLFEGRIAVMVDGTPSAIFAPYFFIESFHMAEDYSLNKYYTNLSRFIRSGSFITSLLLPGLFIALSTNHISLIPMDFVFRLATSRSGVPFPTIIEVLLMSNFFAISREAGLRLPPRIGPALSIVAGIILGDAAVGAGLASQATLIVVGISSLSALVNPQLYGPILVWSMLITILSAVLGLPGFYIGFCTFVAHICGLNTCGYPYVYPLGTLKRFKYKETIFRDDLDKISNSLLDRDEIK